MLAGWLAAGASRGDDFLVRSNQTNNGNNQSHILCLAVAPRSGQIGISSICRYSTCGKGDMQARIGETLHVFNVFDRLDLYQFIYKCSTAGRR